MTPSLKAQVSQWVDLSPGFSSDSRELQEGFIFLALSGLNVDGCRFIDQALEVEGVKVFCPARQDTEKWADHSSVLRVEDIQSIHRLVAHHFRKKFDVKVIAVGGSNGKTTTKEFLFHFLRKKYRCIKTMASQNGFLGIPKTLEQLSPAVEIAVVEVGIDGPGDMDQHMSLLEPDVALLTSIGAEHLNLLKNLEGVFKEERVLIDKTLALKGKAYIPEGDPYLSTLSVLPGVVTVAKITKFKKLMDSPLEHTLQNVSLAAKVAQDLGVAENDILSSIPQLEIPQGRGVLKEAGSLGVFLEDFYNANFISMKAAIEASDAEAKRRNLPLVLVLGDMLDLGESTKAEHQRLVEVINKTSAAEVVLVGPELSAFQDQINCQKRSVFKNSSEASHGWSPSKKALYLFKGSRGLEIEKIIPELKNH